MHNSLQTSLEFFNLLSLWSLSVKTFDGSSTRVERAVRILAATASSVHSASAGYIGEISKYVVAIGSKLRNYRLWAIAYNCRVSITSDAVCRLYILFS